MIIPVNLIMTVCVGVLVFLLGDYVVKRISFLERYCIPAPVVGGLIFAIVHTIGVSTGWFTFKFDAALRDFFLIGFFATIGFTASWRVVRQGGVIIVILVFVSSIMLVLQNVWGIQIARMFDLNPLIGFCAGSISLMGGVGSSAAFAPIMEENGAIGGLPIAIASATFGLVSAGLVSGPIAKFLIEKFNLLHKAKLEDASGESNKIDYEKLIEKEDTSLVSPHNLYVGFFQLIIAMGVGQVISILISKTGMIFPAYVGAIFAAAFIRNGGDALKMNVRKKEIDIFGTLFLNIFLSMTIMQLEVWKLAGMAGPLLIILIGQIIILSIFSVCVVFFTCGRDYDGALITAGFYGYAMGATPNALASMNACVQHFGRPSPKAFFTVPIVGGFLMDFMMAILIIGHMNLILKGIL